MTHQDALDLIKAIEQLAGAIGLGCLMISAAIYTKPK